MNIMSVWVPKSQQKFLEQLSKYATPDVLSALSERLKDDVYGWPIQYHYRGNEGLPYYGVVHRININNIMWVTPCYTGTRYAKVLLGDGQLYNFTPLKALNIFRPIVYLQPLVKLRPVNPDTLLKASSYLKLEYSSCHHYEKVINTPFELKWVDTPYSHGAPFISALISLKSKNVEIGIPLHILESLGDIRHISWLDPNRILKHQVALIKLVKEPSRSRLLDIVEDQNLHGIPHGHPPPDLSVLEQVDSIIADLQIGTESLS